MDRRRWLDFLAHLLFVVAAWTIFIKYLFPPGYAWFRGEPLTRHVYWDLWPVAHIGLGWALLTRPPWTRGLALVISVAEIAIIVALFVDFLTDPEWTIWRTNWFVNKVFVLGTFILILTTILLRPGWLARAGDTNACRGVDP